MLSQHRLQHRPHRNYNGYVPRVVVLLRIQLLLNKESTSAARFSDVTPFQSDIETESLVATKNYVGC